MGAPAPSPSLCGASRPAAAGRARGTRVQRARRSTRLILKLGLAPARAPRAERKSCALGLLHHLASSVPVWGAGLPTRGSERPAWPLCGQVWKLDSCFWAIPNRKPPRLLLVLLTPPAGERFLRCLLLADDEAASAALHSSLPRTKLLWNWLAFANPARSVLLCPWRGRARSHRRPLPPQLSLVRARTLLLIFPWCHDSCNCTQETDHCAEGKPSTG